MSNEVDIRWRVKFNDDKSIVFEVLIDGVKVGEQGFVRLIDNLMQGQSSLRWQEMKR